MKIVDIITNALTDELGCGNIPGFVAYVPSPENEAVLKELEQEDKQRYLKVEAAFRSETSHECNQHFRAGFAAGLQLAAETFNGLASTRE
jgi:hypothetical protein